MMVGRTSYVALAAALNARRSPKGGLSICIDGAGASGKSSIARGLGRVLEGAQIIHQDDFFRPRAERFSGLLAERPHGADFELERLRSEVLEPLRQGRPAAYRTYDWERDVVSSDVVRVTRPLVIVEGVYSSSAAQRAYFDVAVWVECPRPLRLARGLARDGEAARSLWEEDWMPGEDRYIADERPRERADLVCDGARLDGEEGVFVLEDRLGAGA